VTPHLSTDPSVWIAALLTLAVFGFLWRDNPVYRFVEHLFVGVTAGWLMVLAWWTVIVPHLGAPLMAGLAGRADAHGSTGSYGMWVLIPATLGVLMLARLDRRTAWLAGWPLALVLGVYAGLRTTGFAHADLVLQLRATLRPLWTGDVAASLDAIVFTLGVVTCLMFFAHAGGRRGVPGVVVHSGTAFLMVGFGAAYGYTVMSRVSLLIGRVQFLLFEWLGLR
jgi:hypothetical protein